MKFISFNITDVDILAPKLSHVGQFICISRLCPATIHDCQTTRRPILTCHLGSNELVNKKPTQCGSKSIVSP